MRYLPVLTVLAVFAASACSRPAETDTTSGGAAPAAAGSAGPAAAAGPTFTGAWTSNYGPMTLAQAGSQVTGTYGGSGRVRGTVAGDRFTGHWIGVGQTCATLVDGADTWGNLELTLRADGQHFDGQWSYCDRPVGGTWNGDRTGASVAATGPAAAASPPSSAAAPSAEQQRAQAESFVWLALRAYERNARDQFSDEQLYTPAFAALLASDRAAGGARVAPADPLCMCADGDGITVGDVTASMPGMDGQVGVQAVLNGPGGPRTVRYRLAWVPGQTMKIDTISAGERGDRYYDGLWQVLSRARREAAA